MHLVGVIDAAENQIAVEFGQLRLNSLKYLHEEERGKERDHRHHRIRTFTSEAPGVRMGTVIETSCDTENSLARFLRDTWVVVEYPGNGSDAYFRLASDIIDCWRQNSIFLGRASTNLGIISLESSRKTTPPPLRALGLRQTIILLTF